MSKKLSSLSLNSSEVFPIQIEYLKKLKTNFSLSLKQNCLILLSKLITSENSNLNLDILPLDLKQELIHFLLEYRLLYNYNNVNLNGSSGNLNNNINNNNNNNNNKIIFQTEIFQSIADNRIKSLDFSVVKSKISIGDPTKDILKLCTDIKNLDFSNCYNVNDSFLKIIINNLQSSLSSSSSSSSTNISPLLLSKSKSIEFNSNERLSSIETNSSGSDDPNSSGGSASIIIPPTPIPPPIMLSQLTPKKQKRFSLKNKIFSKKKQQDEINNPECNSSSSSNNNNNNCNNSQQQELDQQVQIQQVQNQQQQQNQKKLKQSNEELKSNDVFITPSSPRQNLQRNSSILSNILSSNSQKSPSFNENFGLFFLSLKQCSSVSDKVIRKIIKLSPNIQYLDLTGCKITPKTLLYITTTCTKLKTLNIGNIDFPISPILAQSISKLQSLASLDLSSIPKLTTQLLTTIITYSSSNGIDQPHRATISEPPTPRERNSTNNNNNSNLNQMMNKLQISNSQQQQSQSPPTSPDINSSTTTNSNLSLQHQQQSIQSTIKNINLSPSIQSLASISTASSNLYTPRSVLSFEMFGVFPNTLLTLNLSQTDIDDASLLILARRCIYLQDLDISFCTKITNQGLTDISNYLCTLVSFSAKIIKASYGLVDLIIANFNLIKLDLQYTKLEESHLKEIFSSVNLTNLNHLRLDGTPITDEIFRMIPIRNKNLKVVGLSSCKGISWDIFTILATQFKTLKKLYISHCKMGANSSINISGGSGSSIGHLEKVKLFFSECSELVVLDISFTPLVKDSILQLLIDSGSSDDSSGKVGCSRSLESLFIGGGFHNLSSSILHNLVIECNRIRVFSCIQCYNIKDETISLALDKWLLLEALELTDCISLSTSTITNYITSETSHIHSHLRFIFFSNLINNDNLINNNNNNNNNFNNNNNDNNNENSNNIDENLLLNKVKENSSLEIFEFNREITLENVINQGWLNI
ncbi:hypothetical protein DDB_G0284561 [Dictyostelium discoideum AX4]|uniref:RNI-like protein n=1 Tax=Dictyostelium discoideum TaxID=44689 RepID=Q54PH6_DICDI|nr:hypothetical protein DDB_G0284561 [Dictyostelium discoideum AX4]EAL65207.1 hypothetical protein DDB_G0284561 [Dictyostelium discoideum AX4]|eukprot:XP_638556.1 hypothetical protein DDB_G0284561 [Dictyostelium discoideum AX4]